MKRFLIQRTVEQEEDREAEDPLENCSTQTEVSTYRLDTETRELRDLASRGALSCRRPERSEGATKGSEDH